MQKLILETTAPFQGLPELVAHDEGLFEQGKADMYNTCEWGNYCRVQDTGVGSRQVGRRAIVTYSAMMVAPDSPIYTPQQLAHRIIGVPFYFGTHYIALHMLEGFLRRRHQVVRRAQRFALSACRLAQRRGRRRHAHRATRRAG
jgi:hypothetical protein